MQQAVMLPILVEQFQQLHGQSSRTLHQGQLSSAQQRFRSLQRRMLELHARRFDGSVEK
jgi:hypothetical protein